MLLLIVVAVSVLVVQGQPGQRCCLPSQHEGFAAHLGGFLDRENVEPGEVNVSPFISMIISMYWIHYLVTISVFNKNFIIIDYIHI